MRPLYRRVWPAFRLNYRRFRGDLPGALLLPVVTWGDRRACGVSSGALPLPMATCFPERLLTWFAVMPGCPAAGGGVMGAWAASS